MFSAIRRRMRISPATVIASLALVFAMTGGAYAAKKYLITSTSQIKPSVLKSLQGKAGPAGSAGAAGAQGAQGPAGGAGPQGPAGANGTNGANGQSVASAKLSKGNANCKEGGSEFKSVSGATFACNGEAAAGGGYPATLPEGKTETGAWAFVAAAEGGVYDPISFSVPLEGPLDEAHTHYILINGKELHGGEERAQTVCTGTAAAPTAAEGNLCVYEGAFPLLNVKAAGIDRPSSLFGAPGADAVGAALAFTAEASSPRLGAGTWAVTAGP